MSEEKPPEEGATAVTPGDEDDEVTPGYTAPKQVDLATIKALDADDESLVKYKQTLLGQTEGVLDEGGNNVKVKQLVFTSEGRPDVVLDLTGDLTQFKKKPFVIKEGVQYRIKIVFRVQREIVSGLRYFQNISRKGIRVDKQNYMVGSYGPKTETQTFTAPGEDAPSGMISRGSYSVKSKFTDDDKNIYLEWEWAFEIKKEWE